VIAHPAGGEFPALGRVLRKGGDADVGVEVVLEGDDVVRVADVAAELGQDRYRNFEYTGGRHIQAALDLAVQRRGRRGILGTDGGRDGAAQGGQEEGDGGTMHGRNRVTH